MNSVLQTPYSEKVNYSSECRKFKRKWKLSASSFCVVYIHFTEQSTIYSHWSVINHRKYIFLSLPRLPSHFQYYVLYFIINFRFFCLI